MLIKHHQESHKKKQIMEEVITKCFYVLSLDRFADYQTDQSVILVRMIAADIMLIAFKTLSG
jgi:hypothetical protein